MKIKTFSHKFLSICLGPICLAYFSPDLLKGGFCSSIFLQFEHKQDTSGVDLYIFFFGIDLSVN